MSESWRARLSRPASAAGLGAFRALFGLLMCFGTLRFLARGWIEELYVRPEFHFSYLGFEWLRPWPTWGLYLHFALMFVAALALAVGLYSRLSAAAFGLLFTWAELFDKATYLNHYYLVSLLALLLVVVPCGNACSVDSWRARRRGEAPAPVAWAHYGLLRAQLFCVYTFAGLAKLNSDWLLRAEPVRGWLLQFADWPLLGRLFVAQPSAFAMSWAGALFDLSVVPLLWWKRTRKAAFALALVFHLSNWLMFPIGIFSWLMLVSLTLCWDPDWPAALLGRWSRVPHPRSCSRDERPLRERSPRLVGRTWLALAGAYLLLQFLLPLRGLLYPGELNWTEQGFRFAWRVMLIEKTGSVEYEVETPRRRFLVSPRDELSALQLRMLSTQPDMIHEYALHLARRYSDEGPVKVRARAYASLNGRPSQPLIDPEFDLASAPLGLGPAPYIVPLERPGAELAAR
ncbi:MAG: HTTM domain-containing protein [Polyangiaceae bacterium]